MRRSSWNDHAVNPGRAPAGVRAIPVQGRDRGEATRRAMAMPWWPRVEGEAFLSRGAWFFRVRG